MVQRLLRRSVHILWLPVICTFLLGGCGEGLGAPFDATPRILFQHDWEGNDAEILAQLLGNYALIHPELQIVSEYAPPEGLEADYEMRHAEGIEPDIVLADVLTAQNLIRKGLVADLNPYDIDKTRFSPAALAAVSAGDQLFGLPFALTTQLLFYNKATVPQPPATMAELERVTAEPGIVMGLNTSFSGAFWGLRAFGASSYDGDGRFVIGEGALVNWLTALTAIQGDAGFMLSDDQAQLRRQFLAGETDLYVADAAEVGLLRAGLGEDLGIATLPAGSDNNPAGPLLHASVLMVSANADARQTEEALRFIEFLTNSQQQSLLTLSDTGRMAAANTVYVSPSMPDVVVQLATQMGSVVPITLAQRAIWDQVAVYGQPIYRAVLEGVVDEQQAAADLVDYVNNLQGIAASPALSAADLCPQAAGPAPLTLTVWHAWSEAEARVLAQLADQFAQLCPGFTVALEAFENVTALDTRYRAAVEAGNGPDVLISSTAWMALLAQDRLIRSLNEEILPGELAVFVPSAVSAVHYDGQIYAYPESVRSLALFYNPTLVTSPAKTLHELQLQINNGRGFAMPLSFFYAYWGLAAFGSRTMAGAESAGGGAAHSLGADGITVDEGARAWLEWLHDAARRPGYAFTVGRAEAEQLFTSREAAYLVTGPWSLPRLRAALPPEEIAVALLPSGPRDRAAPVLEVEGFMINSSATPAAVAGGLAFARYVTSAQGAEDLLTTGLHVPANVTVDLSATPVIDQLSDQAHLAQGVIQDAAWRDVARLGDSLYESVVSGAMDVADAAAAFMQAAGALEAAGDAD